MFIGGNKCVDFILSFLQSFSDLTFRFCRDILIIDTCGKSNDGHHSDSEACDVINENPSCCGPMVSDDTLYNPSFKRSDGVFVDDSLLQFTVFHNDIRAMWTISSFTNFAMIAGFRLVFKTQILWKQYTENIS